MLKFAIIGCILDVDPNALSKLEIKYKKNIIIKELIITFENLSFGFISFTIVDAKKTREERKNGKHISPYKCILKSTAEYPSSSRKLMNVNNRQIEILEGEDKLSVISSDLILVL
tara:strand:- start:11 stop:355 length:345 start_codon:yes stop_codon:yes gene_type:complete